MPNEPSKIEPVLLKLPDAAKYLGISLRQLRALRQRGEIPTVKLGERCPRIHIRDLNAYIEAKTVRARAPSKKSRRRS